MSAAELPPDEEERLRTLYSYEILDTVEEQSFDDVCYLAATVCKTPIALVTLLDRQRQWFKSVVGLDVKETERDNSFCAHAILGEDLLVVHDAHQDPRFADNPLVLNAPKVRFYAGVLLRAFDGRRLGAVCVIDQQPRDVTTAQREALFALARQVEMLLELHRTRHLLEQTMEQRTQLARFVVHDLNNPLATLMLNAEALLWDESLSANARKSAERINEQLLSVDRLVKNFQDVAARNLEVLMIRPEDVPSAELIHAVFHRAQFAAQLQHIRLESQIDDGCEEFRADRGLIERIIDNLVHNAIAFSPPSAAVIVRVEAFENGGCRLSVTDSGPGIPEAERERIFEPYVRLSEPSRCRSRGLGLAFCRAAADAHAGRIWVEPNVPQGSRFILEIPATPGAEEATRR